MTPNRPAARRIEIPDKVRLSDGTYFNPNAIPDRVRAPVADRRPTVLLEAAGFESAEDWGNSILAKRNGSYYRQQKGELGDDGLMRVVDDESS